MKNANYPIRNREELKKVLAKNVINFEGKMYDAKEIAVHITEYPIHKASDLIKFFLEEEEEEEVELYNESEATFLAQFEMMMKS